MAVLEKWRYEIHVSIYSVRVSANFYVIDRLADVRHPWCKWPQDVLELMYSNFAAFNAQTVVIEDVDPDRGPMGIYGSCWYYELPPMGRFVMRHPFLRWLLGTNPEIWLRLNEAGEALAEKEARESMTAAHSAC